MLHGIEVVDFHMHLSKYEFFQKSAYAWFAQKYPSEADYDKFSEINSNPANFTKLLSENSVDIGVVLAEVAPLTTGVASNQMVEDFCKDSPKLIPFCTLNPYCDPDLAGTIENLHCVHGFKGVKLYPTYNYFYPNERMLYPLYATAQRLNIPILFHTGSSIFKNSRIKYGNPILFDDVAVDFPDLKIVMAHGGRGAWYDEAMIMARLHENIYIEVSGLPPHKLLEFFPDMDRFSHKFIFGSDWPSVSISANIESIFKLDLSLESKTRILGSNAKKILKI